MRGENTLPSLRLFDLFGSPPHAWGKCLLLSFLLAVIRFTPTCVGKMFCSVITPPEPSVHPHMRGENLFFRNCSPGYSGSPPHAWGKCFINIFSKLHDRFTPTCVGKIIFLLHYYPIISVHPHMRGENWYGTPQKCGYFGSPPHAWGKFQQSSYRQTNYRFTPTCVGKIPGTDKSLFALSVHPHMRGENIGVKGLEFLFLGSPPHAWGK